MYISPPPPNIISVGFNNLFTFLLLPVSGPPEYVSIDEGREGGGVKYGTLKERRLEDWLPIGRFSDNSREFDTA